MSTETKNPLARAVKRILDFFRVIAFISLILWPISALVMTIGQSSHADTWGVDISVFSSFNIDLNEIVAGTVQSDGIRDPIINGKAELKVDTSSLPAFYIFALMTEIGGIVGFYLLLQLRAVFTSLAAGDNFDLKNSLRIRNFGYVAIGWALTSPLLQYFGGRVILQEYSLNLPGIVLSPAFEINGGTIFIGLAMIVLSGVLNEAASINESHQLTI
jgi:hypothetical protein